MVAQAQPGSCSLSCTLSVVGERWTFLVLREALAGATRFSELRAVLGIAPDILSQRLAMLVAAGILERRPYREPGQRARDSYHLTDKGRKLGIVIAALQQWGVENVAPANRGDVEFRGPDGLPVTLQFVDSAGRAVAADDVTFWRAPIVAGEAA